MTRLSFYVRAGVFFLVGVAVGALIMQPSAAQEKSPNNGLKLLVVGIAVKDYSESQNFYEKIMGFKTTVRFSSADGKRTTTYYQMGRDSFLEMQTATAAMPPGLTHVHLMTDDLTATVERLRQAGLAPAAPNATPSCATVSLCTSSANTVTEPGGPGGNIKVKSANVFDPNGIRLELNELVPESLTKKAMDSWR